MERLMTLSDLYRGDIGEANILLVYPTSASRYEGDERFFFNKKWVIDDELSPDTEYYSLNISAIHNHIITGDFLKIVGEKVPTFLQRHWGTSLDQGITIKYGKLNDEIPHVEIFPLEAVHDDLHAVNPDALYKLTSKRYITEIPCQQAEELNDDNMEYPCVLKICMQMSGSGVWVVSNEAEHQDLTASIRSKMPSADIITTKFINNVQKTLTGNFFISKQGQIKWLGVTESLFDPQGLYFGTKVDGKKQEEFKDLIFPTMRQITASLHEDNFFGVVNIDVVVDARNECYVVDVNPRLGSPTKLILILLYLKSKGYTQGIHFTNFKFRMCATDAIKIAEGIKEGKVIILSCIESTDGHGPMTICYILIYAKDSAAYHSTIKTLCSASKMSEVEAAEYLLHNIRSYGCRPLLD